MPLNHIKLFKAFGQEPSSLSQIRNWFFCKVSFESKSIHKKTLNLVMGKVQIYNRHRKTFRDIAKYLNSKHLKYLPKLHKKNTFCQWQVFQGSKDIFLNSLQAAPTCQLKQTYIIIMFQFQFLLIKSYFFYRVLRVKPSNTPILS